MSATASSPRSSADGGAMSSGPTVCQPAQETEPRERAAGSAIATCATASTDVRYRKYLTVVELDGNATHPSEDRELDRARDNEVAERAEVTLRYGWKSVAGSPCATAAQVGRVLASRGWNGRLRGCGPACVVRRP